MHPPTMITTESELSLTGFALLKQEYTCMISKVVRSRNEMTTKRVEKIVYNTESTPIKDILFILLIILSPELLQKQQANSYSINFDFCYFCSISYPFILNLYNNCLKMIKKIEGYRILLDKKLGKGSYGTVYEGKQDKTDLSVAVKVLSKSSINEDPYLKAALFSQIKIMKILKSPNVVQLYDVLQSSNNYYIVEEICDGDLQKLLKKQGHLPEKQAVRIITEICNGFLPLIKEGIIHRDLKPANIFLLKGSVKIGDFGFAKKNQGGLKKHTSVGTPLYSSVEMLKNLPYTSKCDIWAIGFIFYEMLHGKTPWIANSQYELVNNIEKIPLKVNQNLEKNTIDFLQKILKPHEQNRIDWPELYAHPIFQKHFLKQIQNSDQLENKYKKVMADIRFNVNSQNIDLKKVWNLMGFTEKSQLNKEELRSFLNYIVPNIQSSEENYFLAKMDKNLDGKVSLFEIEEEFKKHNIEMNSKFSERIPFLNKKVISIEQEALGNSDHNHIDIELENKIRSCFKRLENQLTKKQVTLFKVFVAYDTDKSGSFTFQQFAKVLRKIDDSFTNEELKQIFTVVDEDNSNTIQFSELNAYYSKINGIPQSLNMAPESNFFKKPK